MTEIETIERDMTANSEARQNADTIIEFLKYNNLPRERMNQTYGNIDKTLSNQFALMDNFAKKYKDNR